MPKQAIMVIDRFYANAATMRSAQVQHLEGSPMFWVRYNTEGCHLGDLPYSTIGDACNAALMWAREGICEDLRHLVH